MGVRGGGARAAIGARISQCAPATLLGRRHLRRMGTQWRVARLRGVIGWPPRHSRGMALRRTRGAGTTDVGTDPRPNPSLAGRCRHDFPSGLFPDLRRPSPRIDVRADLEVAPKSWRVCLCLCSSPQRGVRRPVGPHGGLRCLLMVLPLSCEGVFCGAMWTSSVYDAVQDGRHTDTEGDTNVVSTRFDALLKSSVSRHPRCRMMCVAE